MPEQDPDCFLSSIAHDFKTPLTGIQMILHLLSEQRVGPLNERQVKMIQQARADCERLVETVHKHFESGQ